MTIAKRLTLLLAVPLLVLAVLGLFVAYQLNHIEFKNKFVGIQIESLAVMGNISQCLTEMRVSTRTYFLTQDKDEQARAEKTVRQNAAELKRLLARYGDSLVSDDKDRRLFTEVVDLSHQWSVEAQKLIALSASGKRADAMAMLISGTFPELGTRLGTALNEWIKHNEELAVDAGTATQSAVADSERKLLGAVAGAMLLSGILGLLTFRRIVHPIQALQASVESIADGDYGQTVPFTNATDETGSLARSIAVLKQGAATTAEQGWVKAHVAKLASAFQSAESLPDFGHTFFHGSYRRLVAGPRHFISSKKTQDGSIASLLTGSLKIPAPLISSLWEKASWESAHASARRSGLRISLPIIFGCPRPLAKHRRHTLSRFRWWHKIVCWE